MRHERRENKNGTVYYSFVWYDGKSGKQTRLTRKEIRKRFGKDITTEEDAEHCLKLLQAKYESEKIRIKRRITWEEEYYSFAKLLDQYGVDQKKTAPNSWENSVFYLKHYVLYYFLQEQKLNNIELWPDHYEGFRTYLETAKTIRGKRVIAWQSKNHAIKALNTFMSHLAKKNLIEKAIKCDTFAEHLMNRRTIDDVIHPEEMEKVYKELQNLGHTNEAHLFRYLFFSGMRFSEGMAISLGDLYQGDLGNDFLVKKMKAYEIEYHGYIVSDSQYGGINQGKVIRLPFKGQKAISEKNNRIIPIVDKALWNVLVDLAETAFKENPTKERRDCLLFPGIDDATASRRLEEAFIAAKLRYRTWHCLRHSRATWLIGETGDVMLARVWLGHNSPRTIEKYNHIYQALTRSAKAQTLTGKQFALKRV